MLLAWKKAQRFEASTFLPRASVCAPLPSVSESARNSAITAISNAIFLLEPEACSACSACSMLSCALMIFPPWWPVSTIDRTISPAQGASRCDGRVSGPERAISGAGMRCLVDFEQPFGIDTGIDLRGRKGSVAEQFLDRAEVAAAAQKMGRERMT